jgi:PPOX class probable F420-dependent enzyme
VPAPVTASSWRAILPRIVNLAQDEARSRLAAARVARLGTVDERGAPHLVPVTFAAVDDRIVTAVDHKPKRTTELARLRNLRARPRVCVLADHYEERWEALWWVRADGVARILSGAGDAAEREEVLDLLAAKYPPYRLRRPQGAVISVAVERWSGWAWTGPPGRRGG